MRASDYRRVAREALKGQWRRALPVYLLYTLIVNGFGLSAVWKEFFSVQRAVDVSWMGDALSYSYRMPTGAGWLLMALTLALCVLSWIADVGLYRVGDGLLDGRAPSARQLFPAELAGRAVALGI